MLKIAPEALTLLAAEAIKAINFTLRPAHLAQVAAILDDPEASENDRMVALMLLKNAEIASHGILPFCQDTGTATIIGKKGQQVWTGCDDAELLSKGIYQTYTRENLRYSQTAPLTMYDEVNTKTNLPAQIDLYATEGDAYKFLFVSKGGGSANKTFLYQETKALLNPDAPQGVLPRENEVARHRRLPALSPRVCHRRHLRGELPQDRQDGVHQVSTTHCPTAGNEHGQAFRDVELEKELLAMAREVGIGAQFGGKYLALDVRVIRLPRHGASCPVGIGVSCSADRQAKAKITKDGIFLEKLEKNPGRFIPEKYRDWKFKGVAVNLDLGMEETLKTLSKYPVTTALALTGTIIVARDIAHAKLKEILEKDGDLPGILQEISRSTTPAPPRLRPACPPAPSAPPPPGAWTVMSISSRPTAARWSCSPRATARKPSPTPAKNTAASTSAPPAAPPPCSPRTTSSPRKSSPSPNSAWKPSGKSPSRISPPSSSSTTRATTSSQQLNSCPVCK